MAYFMENYFNMIRLYFANEENAALAAREYQRIYPNVRHPDANVIRGAVRRFRETGNVMPVQIEGRPRNVRNPEVKEDVMARVEADPRTSTRVIGREMGISHVLVHKILKENKIHPYHFIRVQQLLPRDHPLRQRFVRNYLEAVRENQLFPHRVLWTNKCTFTQNGTFNSHNYHYYGVENPFLTWDNKSQYRFKVNVWAGLIDDELIGPVFLPERLNGLNYLDFLRDELPNLLFPPAAIDDMPLFRRNIIFMHDGCPAHNAAPVREYLNNTYGNNWMGRGAPFRQWPPRSPDLNPCDFFLRGAQTEKIYFNRIETQDELEERIRRAFATVQRRHIKNATESVAYRAIKCLEANGGQYQHLM